MKLAIGGGVAFVAGLILTPTAATAPGKSPAEASPELQIKAIDRQIGKVELSAMNVWIVLDLNETWSSKQYPFAGAMVVRRIAEALQAGQVQLPSEARYLQIQLTAPTKGRLGEEGRARLMSFRLLVSDLRRANLGKMTEPDLLNIPEEVTVGGKAGADVIEEYCADADYAQSSATFCRNAL